MLLLSMALLAAAQDTDLVTAAVDNTRALTRADVPCERPNDGEEIVVCANRDADRYRVPFVSTRSRDSVPLRTGYLTQDFGAPACGNGAFLLNCGAVGVTATFSSDGSTTVRRELAH